MLRILLSGCNGRMGKAVSELARETEGVVIAAGFDQNCATLFDYPVYSRTSAEPSNSMGSE